jgi:hypothetical protein
VFFLQRSIYSRTAAASFSVTMVGVTPYKIFLKVPWVNKQLASSDFAFMKSKRPLVQNIANNGAGRTSCHLFSQPVIENRGVKGFLGDCLAKTSSAQICLVI